MSVGSSRKLLPRVVANNVGGNLNRRCYWVALYFLLLLSSLEAFVYFVPASVWYQSKSLGFPLDVSVLCVVARFSVLAPLGFPRFISWMAAFGGGGLGFCAAFWGPVFWALRFSLSLLEPNGNCNFI
ncbi:hypothetical protein M5K25_009584 [Dendrobium thyrsiflorum]|uniref:Uncharacterized protein n=1 Tax=Dendrobium thyrsiflorum TaxID=117978 RepID=A0ABD0V6T2_DENTH